MMPVHTDMVTGAMPMTCAVAVGCPAHSIRRHASQLTLRIATARDDADHTPLFGKRVSPRQLADRPLQARASLPLQKRQLVARRHGHAGVSGRAPVAVPSLRLRRRSGTGHHTAELDRPLHTHTQRRGTAHSSHEARPINSWTRPQTARSRKICKFSPNLTPATCVNFQCYVWCHVPRGRTLSHASFVSAKCTVCRLFRKSL